MTKKKSSSRSKASKKGKVSKKGSAVNKKVKKTPVKKKRQVLTVRTKQKATGKTSHTEDFIDSYRYFSENIPITVTISKTKRAFVPIYHASISEVSESTEMVLEKIRKELVKKVNLGVVDILDPKRVEHITKSFEDTVKDLLNKYFPNMEDGVKEFLESYLIAKSIGLGNIKLLMHDENLEEIVVNSPSEPLWVYHKRYGWLKTNIFLRDDEQIRHYASMIARKVGRQITLLEPLLDAHLEEGDRVNATLLPISTAGNTMTIRKFSRDPWTITRLIKNNTLPPGIAALLWTSIQYELSILFSGGTASGKTSTLNAFSVFIPPNQRVISIEDTREIRLPSFLQWVALNTRLPNSEGKGGVSMLNLMVNSLRMRPDRIIVGEVRRHREAETLFEAIHTGHSVYSTLHANSALEVIKRLTNPPIDIPKILIPGINLIVVQFRNRRTGIRRTLEVAEILPDSTINILYKYDPASDKVKRVGKSKALIKTLKEFTGLSENRIYKEINEKERILKYLVKKDIDSVDEVGRIIAEYYTNKEELFKRIK